MEDIGLCFDFFFYSCVIWVIYFFEIQVVFLCFSDYEIFLDYFKGYCQGIMRNQMCKSFVIS